MILHQYEIWRKKKTKTKMLLYKEGGAETENNLDIFHKLNFGFQ